MVACIFGQVEMKWEVSTFPFTEPSLELEIFFQVSVCVCVGVSATACLREGLQVSTVSTCSEMSNIKLGVSLK